MTRSRITPIQQPDEHSCGPASLKLALTILGRRASVQTLIRLCQTNRNGTTTAKMLRAIQKLHLSALVLEKTTLRHLLSSLKTDPAKKRAVLVSYLYATDRNNKPEADSGHWAVVSSYKAATGRIVLLDSYTRQKTSYAWGEFRKRWLDTNPKRRWVSARRWRMIRKKERQLMIIVSREIDHLPKFGLRTARIIN